MNNYYTLIYLKNEIEKSLFGSNFQFAISPHKNVLECWFETSEGRKRLICGTQMPEIALFLDDYQPPKKQNVYNFFEPLDGLEVHSVTLAKFDRLLSIHFECDLELLFKLFGTRANVLLVEKGFIKDAFKHPDKIKGQPAPQPQPPEFAKTIDENFNPKKQITRLNPLLPRNLLPVLIRQHNVAQLNAGEIKAFTQEITDELLNNPQPRVLKNGEFCLWDDEILNLPTDKSFETVNNGIRYTYRNKVQQRRLQAKKEPLKQFLERAIQKRQSEYEQLQQTDKSLERADKYKKYGNLLMTQAHKSITPGAEKIEVSDFYNENRPLSIPIKQGLTIAANAEYYYEKAKASHISYQKARQRAPKIKKESRQLSAFLNGLYEIETLSQLDEWMKSNAVNLEKYGYGVKERGRVKSPFRKFRVGKHEVWVGKNAKNNDELLRRAHKEDIWLHARGVGGSHVVIRMGNEKSNPPKEVVLRAASYAAFYSKAKGSKTDPVIYTKRKYVYKPSGAQPGAAIFKREKVAMVPPMKPE